MLNCPERPKLSHCNEIALGIWAAMRNTGLNFSESMNLLGLNLNNTERYFMMLRLSGINNSLTEVPKDKEKPNSVNSYGWDM